MTQKVLGGEIFQIILISCLKSRKCILCRCLKIVPGDFVDAGSCSSRILLSDLLHSLYLDTSKGLSLCKYLISKTKKYIIYKIICGDLVNIPVPFQLF